MATRGLAAVCLALALVGCATEANYMAMVRTYKQRPRSEVIRAWGQPTSVYEVEHNVTAYEYRWEGDPSLRVTQQPQMYVGQPRTATASVSQPWCVTTFYVDNATDVVTSAAIEGNACRR